MKHIYLPTFLRMLQAAKISSKNMMIMILSGMKL